MSALFALRPRHVPADALGQVAPSQVLAAAAGLASHAYPPSACADELRRHVLAYHRGVAVHRPGGGVGKSLLGALAGAVGGAAVAWLSGADAAEVEHAGRWGFASGLAIGALLAHVRNPVRVAAEVEELLPRHRPGDVLVTWHGRDLDTLRALAEACRRLGMAVALRA